MNNECDIRVLHVTPWFPPHRSGIGNYVSNLSSQLIGYGYKITILTAKRLTERPNSNNNNIDPRIQDIEYVNCFYLPGWPYQTMRSISIPIDAGIKLNSCIKHGDFDIVHVHGIHYPLCWLAIYLAHKHGIPSVLSLHASYPIWDPTRDTKIEQWLYTHVFSRIFSRTGAVIGPADSITSFARKYQRGATNFFYTVEYGLDTSKFIQNLDKKNEYRKKYEIDESATVLLFSGRFERIKGILEFCKAAKKIVQESNRRVEAVIIGSGTLKDQVHSLMGNTSGVHIFDWQPEGIVYQFYIASDILTVPSSSEGMPLTALEAMNAGLHIVYNPIGGLPDILKGYPSKTSLKQVSDTEIYNVLRRLIYSDLQSQDKITSLRYAQSFNWENISQKIIAVYEQVIA